MSFDDSGFDSDELQSIGLYSSCSAIYDQLSNDDGIEPNYWCWETVEGDWSQILTLIMFMFAINLGMYLLTYGAITTGLSKIAGMKQTYVEAAADNGVLNLSTSWNAAPEPIWRLNMINNVTNIPMILIMILLLINTILYFAIKVFIVSHPSSHYINTTNDQFREMSFYSFFNTREIILMYIFTVNSITFWQHQKWYYPKGEFPAAIQPIAHFARLISLVDFIFTIIIFCIYYPLLLVWLYIVAITILIICPLMCFVTCFVAPIITCCVVPCVECCLMGCVRVEQRGNAIICRCMNNCVRFLFGIIVGLVEIVLYFILIAMVLSVAFLIIDGVYGPSHVVFYMDFNSQADGIIYWMYLVTISVGCVGLLIGLFTMIFIDGMRYQSANNNISNGETTRLNNNNVPANDNDDEPNVLV